MCLQQRLPRNLIRAFTALKMTPSAIHRSDMARSYYETHTRALHPILLESLWISRTAAVKKKMLYQRILHVTPLVRLYTLQIILDIFMRFH